MERSYVPIVLLLFVVGGLYLYQSGYLFHNESGSVVAFQKLIEGEKAPIEARVNYRIKTPDELALLWNSLGMKDQPPSIDFTKNEAAADFDGLAPNRGYDIGVIRVVDSRNTRTFLIELERPEPACGHNGETVSPFELIVLPRTTLRLTHTDQPITVSCP